MEVENRYSLITKNLQEVLGKNELKNILENGTPKIYWGCAPTKRCHIGYITQLLKIRDLVNAGCEVTILIADIHAILDNLKSTFDTVLHRTIYYEKILSAILKKLGVDLSKIKFVKGSSFQKSPEYTMDVYKFSSIVTIQNCQHAGAEVVKQTKSPLMTNLLYPILQALDIVYLEADGFIGGIDQRKINTFGLEYLPLIGYNKKYIYLMTPMISGLSSKKFADNCTDKDSQENQTANNIKNKMSSSNDSSKIDLLASPQEIENIISKTYCLDGDVQDNSILKLIENLIFNISNSFQTVKWDNSTKSFCDSKNYTNFEELYNDVLLGSKNNGIHPADLKKSLAMFLINFLESARNEFDNDESRKLLSLAYN